MIYRHITSQEFGVLLFDSKTYNSLPVSVVTDSNRDDLRKTMQSLRFYGGGTNMYDAMCAALDLLQTRKRDIETWIICLTDGRSSGGPRKLKQTLASTPTNIHIVTIGINLDSHYEKNLQDMCCRYNLPQTYESKGCFVRSDNSSAGIDAAFGIVKSGLPVSQTFDRDGYMSDDSCREYMNKYLPQFVRDRSSDMILRSFWIRFLYRRVRVFDQNESFNYNTSRESLGQSLMDVMLDEVQRLLGENQQRDWLITNHAQLVYDFSNVSSPQFRLICTCPGAMDINLRQRLSGLNLPGFRIPTKVDLDNGVELSRILSQALDLPLEEVVKCIDENKFILTIDFTMKLLGIHERVSCRVPCVIEGETGVSKTALTKMYAKLINSSLLVKESSRAVLELQDIESTLRSNAGDYSMAGNTVMMRLIDFVSQEEGAAAEVMELLKSKIQSLPSHASSVYLDRDEFTVSSVAEALRQFVNTSLEQMYFEINVDASLTEGDYIENFDEISRSARKVSGANATIVVFLDGTFQ
jgi:von Willebrand factor type A domain